MEILESIKLISTMIKISYVLTLISIINIFYIMMLMFMPIYLIYMSSASISKKCITRKQKIMIAITLVISMTVFLINTIFSMTLNENMLKLKENQYQTYNNNIQKII